MGTMILLCGGFMERAVIWSIVLLVALCDVIGGKIIIVSMIEKYEMPNPTHIELVRRNRSNLIYMDCTGGVKPDTSEECVMGLKTLGPCTSIFLTRLPGGVDVLDGIEKLAVANSQWVKCGSLETDSFVYDQQKKLLEIRLNCIDASARHHSYYGEDVNSPVLYLLGLMAVCLIVPIPLIVMNGMFANSMLVRAITKGPEESLKDATTQPAGVPNAPNGGAGEGGGGDAGEGETGASTMPPEAATNTMARPDESQNPDGSQNPDESAAVPMESQAGDGSDFGESRTRGQRGTEKKGPSAFGESRNEPQDGSAVGPPGESAMDSNAAGGERVSDFRY